MTGPSTSGSFSELIRLSAWCLLVFLTACDSAGPLSSDDSAAAVDALLERDARFAAMASEEGVAAAYREFLAEDAVQLPDGDYPIIGGDEIYENIVATLDGDQISLTWEAVDAAVSASGDLGYTWGNYFFEAVDEQGEMIGNEGKYVNIWSKSATGEWLVVLDISNQNEPVFIDAADVQPFELAEPGDDAAGDLIDDGGEATGAESAVY